MLDLSVIATAGLFNNAKHLNKGSAFSEGSLNAFMALGKAAWSEARAMITSLLSADTATLRDNAGALLLIERCCCLHSLRLTICS